MNIHRRIPALGHGRDRQIVTASRAIAARPHARNRSASRACDRNFATGEVRQLRSLKCLTNRLEHLISVQAQKLS